jgi:dTDP-4-amino-4,6-dideoxygalactose transaminase
VERANRRHVYNQFTIRMGNRDEVRRRMGEAGVSTAVYYPLPLHLQECFAGLGYGPGDFPESERAAREVLSLPIDPGLGPDEIESVVARLAEVAGGTSR